jgi:hypothetical protein
MTKHLCRLVVAFALYLLGLLYFLLSFSLSLSLSLSLSVDVLAHVLVYVLFGSCHRFMPTVESTSIILSLLDSTEKWSTWGTVA